MGRRVEQTNSSSTAEILYGLDGSKLALTDGQPVTAAFIPLPGGATAVYQGTSLAWYRHADWLGSSRIASTPSRALYYDGAYSPFGEITGETGTPDRNFTGQNQDLTSLFYDFPAREYHPGQGRWLSPDPLGLGAIDVTNPQSCNQYAYVGNSPLNAVDPEGLEGEGSCGPMCQCLAAIYAYYMGEGRYDPFFSLADAQNACMGLPTDTPGSGNNTGPGNGGGTPALPPAPPPVHCNSVVIAAMKKIWGLSSNGSTGVEAGFELDGSPQNFGKPRFEFTNQRHFLTIHLRGNTFANFHVHANDSGLPLWQPSTPENNSENNGLGDTGLADKYHIQVYVVSKEGLGMYDPVSKKSQLLRKGTDWAKPCN